MIVIIIVIIMSISFEIICFVIIRGVNGRPLPGQYCEWVLVETQS